MGRTWICGVINMVVHRETAGFQVLIAMTTSSLKQKVIISIQFILRNNWNLDWCVWYFPTCTLYSMTCEPLPMCESHRDVWHTSFPSLPASIITALWRQTIFATITGCHGYFATTSHAVCHEVTTLLECVTLRIVPGLTFAIRRILFTAQSYQVMNVFNSFVMENSGILEH